MVMLCRTFPLRTAEWCWRTCCTTQTITGSSLRFTMNDLIRHQQVVTEAERGKRGAFDFLTAAERRSGGCTSCRQWLFILPSDLHTNTPSLTKHRHTHTCSHTSTQADTHTHTNFRALVFPLPSRTTTGSLRECVATLWVFVCVSTNRFPVVNKTIITDFELSGTLLMMKLQQGLLM